MFKTTDVYKPLKPGAMHFTGRSEKDIRLLIRDHLMNEDTWRMFTDQFRSPADEADRGWRGEFWGKMMRGACLCWQVTCDDALYRVLEKSVCRLLSAEQPDGGFTSYDPKNEFPENKLGWDMWGRKYVLLGLLYFYEICGSDVLKTEILSACCRHVDRMLRFLGDGKMSVPATSKSWSGVNASSILEGIVRLYALTGNERYLRFAEHIIQSGGSTIGDIFEQAAEGTLAPFEMSVTKAYEVMSCFEGILEYYRVTGIEKWRTAVLNYAKGIIRHEITIIGSAGSRHEIFDDGVHYQLCPEYYGILQETCVTVTWMKFAHRLLLLTGDAELADYIELPAYNAMPGAVNSDGVTHLLSGFPFDSYSPLLYHSRGRCSSGHRVMGDGEYGCCAAIGSAGLAYIPLTAAMTWAEGICISLYLPGSFTAELPSGQSLRACVETGYPHDGRVNLTLTLDQPETFTLRLRIPKWCDGAVITVAGETLTPDAGWFDLTRLWNSGDTVTLNFAMPMRTVRVDGIGENAPYHVPLRKGPVIFARDARLGEPVDSIVDIVEADDGIVNAVETAVDFAEAAYRIPQRDGSRITVVNYSDAGKTWTKESLLTVWMATKKYWHLDVTKPIYIRCIHYKEESPWYLGDADGEVRHCVKDKADAYTWMLEPEGAFYRIMSADGRYLTAVEDGEAGNVRLQPRQSDDAQLWEVNRVVTTKFELISKKYGCHIHEIRWDPNRKLRLFAFREDADPRFSVRTHLSLQSCKSISDCMFLFEN